MSMLPPATHLFDFEHTHDKTRPSMLMRLKCFQNEVIPVRTGASITDICKTFRELI